MDGLASKRVKFYYANQQAMQQAHLLLRQNAMFFTEQQLRNGPTAPDAGYHYANFQGAPNLPSLEVTVNPEGPQRMAPSRFRPEN